MCIRDGVQAPLTSYVNFNNENNSASEHNTAKLFTSFYSESIVYSIEISISYCSKIPKIDENSLYYRLGILPNFCHFCNVLKTLNKSYQQTHHLELNRMVQTILS